MSLGPDNLIVVSQTYCAPVAAVYECFAGEDFFDFCGVELESGQCDFRVGGNYRYTVDQDDFVEGSFRTIEPQAKIVLTWATQGLNGPTGETLVTLSFGQDNEQTTVCIEHLGLTHRKTAKAHEQAWIEILAAVGEELAETFVPTTR